MIPTVVIVGRPNVGKSTLFNRIVGGRVAVVDDSPGVTRDRHYARAEWAGRAFYAADTGGYIPEGRGTTPLSREVRRQAETAIAEADAAILVVDCRTGVHDVDRDIATLLLKRGLPSLVVVNKVDGPRDEPSIHDAWALGLGEPYGVSAISGRGSGDVLDALVFLLPPPGEAQEEDADEVRLAIVGRPNVGKSSLVNVLAGSERAVVDPAAGTTRDPVDTVVESDGARFRLIDTAGLRRKSSNVADVEFYSGLRTLRAMERCHVAVLVVDSSEGLTVGDLKVGQYAWDQGRGLVVAANKWDLVEKDHRTFDEMVKEWREELLLSSVPVVSTCALSGQRAPRVLSAARTVRENMRKRVATSELNDTVGSDIRQKPPPVRGGANVRVLYVAQVGVDPPRFAVFSNRPELVDEAYVRFVSNRVRFHFGFEGAPVVVDVRRSGKRRR